VTELSPFYSPRTPRVNKRNCLAASLYNAYGRKPRSISGPAWSHDLAATGVIIASRRSETIGSSTIGGAWSGGCLRNETSEPPTTNDEEEDEQWIAEVPELPGVLVHGQTRQEAIDKAQVLSLRVLADRLEHGETMPNIDGLFSVEL
jgi:predicted RNase H-like HicB family nuclease